MSKQRKHYDYEDKKWKEKSTLYTQGREIRIVRILFLPDSRKQFLQYTSFLFVGQFPRLQIFGLRRRKKYGVGRCDEFGKC